MMNITATKYIVLGNADGFESHESIASTQDVAFALSARSILLRDDTWREQVLAEQPGVIYFLATHGGFGEDGTLQSFLVEHGMRHTHSPSSAAHTMVNKHKTKLLYQSLQIPTPSWHYQGNMFGQSNNTGEWICKPISGGSKCGLSLSPRPSDDDSLISEQYILGNKEISVWTLGSSHVTALPPLFRFRSRSTLGVLVDAPQEMLREPSNVCRHLALRIHACLNARGIIKTDFVLDSQNQPFAIETDAHPALSRARGAAMQAMAAGMTYNNLIHAIAADHA